MHYFSSNSKFFPTMDPIFLVITWEKDGIGIAQSPCYSHFSTAQYGYGNIQLGTTT